MRPNPHYTRARKIRKNRVTGVYVTHEARRLRRHKAYRTALTHGREFAKDVLWGGLFFVGIWVAIAVLVVGGLVLIG